MTWNEYLRKHLLKDMWDIEPLGHISLEEIEANRKQFNHFIELMDARMRQGYFRYGRNEPGEPARIKYFDYLKQCIRAYEKTGNQECLVDAANLCRLEQMFPTHPNSHFSSSDDDFHAEVIDAQ